MRFAMRPIPKTEPCNWTVEVDGHVCDARYVKISSRFFTVIYGKRPEGYDSVVVIEPKGATTLPWTRTDDGELLVGLVREKRSNMGDDPVWCVMGGFIDPGESSFQAQAREAMEESGLDASRAEELGGMATNSNRAIFVADASAGEGVKAYALRVPFNWLEKDGGRFKLRSVSLLPVKGASELRFFSWRDAVAITADGLARSAIAQLLRVEL